MALWLIFILFSALLLAAWILMLRRDVMHDPQTQVFAIFPFAHIILLPIFFDINFSIILTKTFVLLLIKTAAVSLSLYCTALALKKLPLSMVGPLRNLNPLFVAMLAFLLLGEQLSLTNIFGLVILVAGVILLDVDIRHPKSLQEFKQHIKNPGVLLLVLAAIIISFSPLLDRILLRTTDPFTILWWFAVILATIYWVIHIVQTKRLPIQDLSLHEALWILLSGVVIMTADIFYFLALSFETVMIAVVIGVRRLSNLFVTLFGGAVLHEKNGWYKAVICCVMIAGTVLLVL